MGIEVKTELPDQTVTALSQMVGTQDMAFLLSSCIERDVKDGVALHREQLYLFILVWALIIFNMEIFKVGKHCVKII